MAVIAIISFQVSFLLDEGISPIILQLLQCAICGARSLHQPTTSASSASSNQIQVSKSKKSEKASVKATEEAAEEGGKFDEAQCLALVHQVCKADHLSAFVFAYLSNVYLPRSNFIFRSIGSSTSP